MSSIIIQPEKECTTPRGHGDGDGIRQNISARKRVPISSARKFNARTPKDPTIRLKLENALNEICGNREMSTPKRHQKSLQKSASVAEITPTLSRCKKRILPTPNDSFELYATPRYLDRSTIRRRCTNELFTCALYRRLVLIAWRRCRNDKKSLDEAVRVREQQVNQLQIQIDVLNELRNSEGQKREETYAECQTLKKSIDILELENIQLNEEVQNHEISIEVLQNELKMAKSENNFISDQALKCQDIINIMKNEKKSLDEQLNIQHQEITSQNKIIIHLEDTVRTLQKNLQIADSNYKTKEKKYAQLKCDLKNQSEVNNSLSKQLQSLKEEKTDISVKIENLEDQLNEYIDSCQNLKEINDELTTEMKEITQGLEEKQNNWIRNTKDFALLSLSALQKIANVILPAYLDIYRSL